ncbi:MAG: hypothetical protein ACOY30_11170 [Bacillota bacterium]
MSLKFNPLELVNENEARRRVSMLKKAHPEMSRRQLCELIIARKTAWCALSGAVTALPAFFPGLGTLLSLLGGTAFDIIVLMYFMSELVVEMALIYDRDLRRQGAAREAVWVFLSSIGTDAVSKNISRLAVKQMGKQAFLKIIQDVLISAGIRISQRSLFKIIPLAGSVISGAVNYFFCRKIGKLVADYYDNSDSGEWGGVTIDI